MRIRNTKKHLDRVGKEKKSAALEDEKNPGWRKKPHHHHTGGEREDPEGFLKMGARDKKCKAGRFVCLSLSFA